MFNGEMRSSAALSAAEARSVMRSSSISGEMYSMEKSSGGPPDVAGISTNKKRRSSLGAKMVAIVGLSQWSKSTLQLNQAGKDCCVQELQLGITWFTC
ncbi:regulating synaptic membrane exocytosis protein 3-like [Polyodon spathula]|uniref:regulating synaptic membrane exocytosis protein 3-like n=1 Tax=Polyodon spathula TaxID=7913 RepID=UPI001B7E87EF|nr:regulating synaptic membrane exocytosis protein 3-like [Polyodon spathula]